MTLRLYCANPDIPHSFIQHTFAIQTQLRPVFKLDNKGRTDGKHLLGLWAEFTKSSLAVKYLIKTQMDNGLSHHFLGSFSTD